jgi:hypothetical protein
MAGLEFLDLLKNDPASKRAYLQRFHPLHVVGAVEAMLKSVPSVVLVDEGEVSFRVALSPPPIRCYKNTHLSTIEKRFESQTQQKGPEKKKESRWLRCLCVGCVWFFKIYNFQNI